MAGTIGELGKNRITEETEVGTMIEIVDRFRIRTLYVTNKRGHCGVLMAFWNPKKAESDGSLK